MKFATCFCLACISANAALIATEESTKPLLDLKALLASMVIFYAGSILLNFGVDNWLTDRLSDQWSDLTIRKGVPSIPTLLLLGSVALAQFGATISKNPLGSGWSVLPWMCVITGAVAIVGNIANIPTLMYFVPHYSTAMAIPTGVCFILLGLHHKNSF